MTVSFIEIQFNPEEEDIHDDLIISGKQYKILNSKMNSLFQFMGNTIGKNCVTRVEVDYLLKAQESRLRTLNGEVDKNHEERLVTHSSSFNHEITKLRDVAKARHEIIMENMTETKESLLLKVTKFQTSMSKEVKKLEDNYNFLHEKVDVVAGATTRLVELDKDYSKDLKARFEKYGNVFGKAEEFFV